jgi:hypothetical protein
MKLKHLRSPPEGWFLDGAIHNGGGWVNAIAEFHAPTEEGPPEHIHFYCLRQKAVVLFGEFPKSVQDKIRRCKTVSFQWTPDEARQVIAQGLSDKPWLVTRAELVTATSLLNPKENIWPARFAAEERAVANGTWPSDVDLPVSREYR